VDENEVPIAAPPHVHLDEIHAQADPPP
jgi:hypothetical protein